MPKAIDNFLVLSRGGVAAMAIFLLGSHWAAAQEIVLDWSSPQTLQMSSASLSEEEKKTLVRAGLVAVVRANTTETSFMVGVMKIANIPQAEMFEAMRNGLEGKTWDEIRTIADSMK